METPETSIPQIAPEEKLVNFLKVSTEILNSDVLWDIDELSNLMKSDKPTAMHLISNRLNNSIILNSNQIKTLFLNEENMKLCLETCVKSLLKFINEALDKHEMKYFTLAVEFVENICIFLQACEKSKINLNVKINVFTVLEYLLIILKQINLVHVIEKGPINSTILKMSQAFKVVTFTHDFILRNILLYFTELTKSKPIDLNNKIDIFMEENFLLHLTLLKDVLEYIMYSNLKPSQPTNDLFENLIKVLRVINNYVPEFIKMLIGNCITLMA